MCKTVGCMCENCGSQVMVPAVDSFEWITFVQCPACESGESEIADMYCEVGGEG